MTNETLTEKMKFYLSQGLSVRLIFSQVPGNIPGGPKESITELHVDIGGVTEVDLEVREHHAKTYSAEQKKKMIDTLDQFQAVVTEAIQTKRAHIEQLKTSEEEED